MSGHDSKFRSRKFILTTVIAIGTMMLAAFDKMDGGSVSAVLLACVAAYNWANVKALQE